LSSVIASVARRAPLASFGAGVQDRVGGEHRRREVGRAQQRAAELLHHDAKFHHAEACTAILFRNMDPRQRELCAQLAPHLGIVTVGRLHEAPNLGRGRLVTEKSAQRRAELILFIRKRKPHAPRRLDFRFV